MFTVVVEHIGVRYWVTEVPGVHFPESTSYAFTADQSQAAVYLTMKQALAVCRRMTVYAPEVVAFQGAKP